MYMYTCTSACNTIRVRGEGGEGGREGRRERREEREKGGEGEGEREGEGGRAIMIFIT